MATTLRDPKDYEFDGMKTGETRKIAVRKLPTMLHDYLLVRPDAKKAGAILLPDGVGEKTCTGEVVALGTGTHANGLFVPVAVARGNRVRFGKWVRNEEPIVKVDVGDGVEDLLMMRENDVLWVEP